MLILAPSIRENGRFLAHIEIRTLDETLVEQPYGVEAIGTGVTLLIVPAKGPVSSSIRT
jgi:hypothetical protein